MYQGTEVFTAVLLMIQVFYDVRLCYWVSGPEKNHLGVFNYYR
jgi:hypothetical protein